MRKIKLLLSGLLFASLLQAQETFPVNGVADKREGCYAFTNATIVKDAQTTLTNATMVIRDGKIIALGASGVAVPKDAVVIDCKDKYIYPSFVDIYTDYGVAAPAREGAAGGRGGGGGFGNTPSQITSNKAGAFEKHFILVPLSYSAHTLQNGDLILSNSYQITSSIAAPVVTAILSRLHSEFPNLTANTLKECVLEGATREFEDYIPEKHGMGFLNYQRSREIASRAFF